MVIDSHVHFWKYDKVNYRWIDNSMKALQKSFLPLEIEPTFKRNFVDGCVAVEAGHSELGTRFLAELANTHPIIKGVVGWIDLKDNYVEKKLAELASYPSIRGLIHSGQEEHGFGRNENFRRGISALKQYNYTLDLLILPSQLKAAADLVQAFPDQIFILDHCGKPDIKNKELEEWKKDIQQIAVYPNIVCKLSGLLTETKWKDWHPADFYPYLDVVFEAFGPDRLMFGSDWPVMLVSGIYVQWKSLIEKYMEHLLTEDKEKIFGGNAQNVYGI